MLLTPHRFGRLRLANRIVMAPMTRSRADQPGDVPNALMATYYAQRASAGLIVTEGTPISEVGRGYSMTPGIYTPAQVAGWRGVTEAVHARGGKVFVQLWHVGRRSHTSIAGQTPVSASAVKDPDKVFGPLPAGGFGMIETDLPRAMSLADIQATIGDFVQGARNAMAAGFDGVELHGAHGYLLDQFMRLGSNRRTDRYGGSALNRMRFLVEATEAVAEAIGPDRVGLRVSPFVTEGYADEDPEIGDVTLQALQALAPLQLAYLHFSENISRHTQMPLDYRARARALYRNPIMVAGKYTPASADALLRSGLADLVAFGQPFITNPDFVERVEQRMPLTPVDYDNHSTFYGGDARGYTDYPTATEAGLQPEGDGTPRPAVKLIHYSIRTTQLEASKRFYCDVIGLREGYRPAFKFPGAWLYAGHDESEFGAVHLIGADAAAGGQAAAYLGERGTAALHGTGALDHLAFHATDLPALRRRLDRAHLPYRERTVPDLGLHQVFFEDPSGLTIEMNFAAHEAQACRDEAAAMA